MKWVINIPVWGETYRKRWIERGYPAICAALEYANFPEHRWVIHTDDHRGFYFFSNDQVSYWPRPQEEYGASRELGTADRNGFAQTGVGEAIMFLNADMVPSVEVFKRCAEIFETTPKRLINIPAIRTLDYPPPTGASGKDLAIWALDNRHEFTEDCVWGVGKVKLPPYVIFEKTDVPDNVVMHAFDLHPLAVFKDREFALMAPTASEFVQEFPWTKVYVVRTPEMMIAEPCEPMDHTKYARFTNRVYDRGDVISWAHHAFPCRAQQIQFRQQIILRGLMDPQAQGVANDIYQEVIRTPKLRRFKLMDTMSYRIRIGLMVPAPIRRLIPKSVREFIKNFELREIGWPRP